MDVNKLIYDAIGASFEVYNALGPGLLESVYEKALIHELKLRGLKVSSQVPVEIVYKGETIGADLRLDIIVNLHSHACNFPKEIILFVMFFDQVHTGYFLKDFDLDF